ncbi:transcription termination/antitermination protein NusG [Pontiella sp.]|uniref:transcription termination/antitermination protein NusG n=1 Tax=Pontiella sp. TaxID=2837462 RepID=UPI003562F027
MTAKFPEGKHWYCVRSKPKKERAAAAQIASQLGLEVFCPQIRFRRKTARGPVWFQEALFPGYFFVRFDLSLMKRAVAYSPGVLTIPVFHDTYVPVPAEVLETVRKDLDEEETLDAAAPLAVGDETTILEGSMQGLKVKVIKVMPAEDRVGVLLEMLGTLVEAEFPSDALEHRNQLRPAD